MNNKDYSETGRTKNIELAQHITHFLHNKGNDVIVSLGYEVSDEEKRLRDEVALEKLNQNLS